MVRVLFGCPIFKFQDLRVRENQKYVRETSIHDVDYLEIVGASVEHAKQMMYNKFLQGDYDYYFNVDADISFFVDEENPIDELIKQNKNIVCGLYVLKRLPIRPSHRPFNLQKIYEKDKKFPKDYKFVIPNELHEIMFGAGGCMMIKREVIEKLTKKYEVPNLPMIYNGEYLSEDFAFCLRAKQEGYKIFALPKIKLGHLGEYLYTFKDYKT